MEDQHTETQQETLETVARDMARLLGRLNERMLDGKFRVMKADGTRIRELLDRYRAARG